MESRTHRAPSPSPTCLSHALNLSHMAAATQNQSKCLIERLRRKGARAWARRRPPSGWSCRPQRTRRCRCHSRRNPHSASGDAGGAVGERRRTNRPAAEPGAARRRMRSCEPRSRREAGAREAFAGRRQGVWRGGAGARQLDQSPSRTATSAPNPSRLAALALHLALPICGWATSLPASSRWRPRASPPAPRIGRGWLRKTR